MKTIEKHVEINKLLCEIDAAATKAINGGKKFTVEWRNNGITKSQFDALHVWIRHCVKYLNGMKLYRCAAVTGRRVPWDERSFKDDVYKVVLKALSEKASTKDQNTTEPNDIRLAISGHMASWYGVDVVLPEWPSLMFN